MILQATICHMPKPLKELIALKMELATGQIDCLLRVNFNA